MKKYAFQLSSEDDLILLEAFVNDYPLVLALDTAASQTVIDWNALVLAGCSIPQELEMPNTVMVETAAGIMSVPIYDIANFKILGFNKPNFQVLTYDFLAKGLTSPYDGVLGLDFFRNQWLLSIDFVEEQLWIAKSKIKNKS